MYLNNQKPKDIHECIKRLKEGCERLAEENGYDKFGLFNSPVTEEQIKAVEEKFGIKLPYGYKEFVKVSNGAWIMKKRIYGINSIGMSNPYVPDGYLALSDNELTTERLTISKKDGKLYMFWESEPDECAWTFEEYLMSELEECEENIIDIQKENERRSKDPETLKREEEEEREAAEAKERINKILEERRRKNNG